MIPPDWLPQWLFVILYAVPPLILLWVIHKGFQTFAPHWILKDQDENMAAGGIASIAALTGIVLAFVLAITFQTNDTFQNDIGVEATQIRNMDKLLAASQDTQALSCRQPLISYAQSIVDDEWPQLQKQTSSPITSRLLNELNTCLLKIKSNNLTESVIYLEIIKLSNDITQSRETRIGNSAASISTIFWIVMHIGLFLTIVLSALAFYTPGQLRVVNCSIQILFVSILMALVMILDRPYLGDYGVSNEPIKHVITHIQDPSRL